MRQLKAAAVGAILSFFCSLILLTAAYARADEAPARVFDISPQSLATALTEFARQSQQEILFAPDVVASKRSGGVRGSLQPVAALQLLLKDSGLTFTTTPSGAILVGAPSGSAFPVPSGTAPALSADGGGLQRDDSEQEGQKKSFWSRFRLAQANQGSTADSASVAAEESGGPNSSALEQIVVTAQKRAERLERVPMSISVLSGRELDRSTGEGITEALNSVPGVATQQNYLGGGTIVVVRGVAPAFSQISGSSPVAYYLDSVPFGLVKSAIAPDSAAYDLQRVEVLRGPQGTLYGASALNGVVRILTQDASLDELEFKARTSVSSTQDGSENYRGDLALNVPLIAGKLGARAVAGYQNLGGWIDQPNRADANDAEVRNFRLKLNAQPTEALSMGLSAWLSRSDFGAPPIGFAFDKNASVLDQPTFTDYDAYSATIRYQSPSLSLTSSTGYLDYSNGGTLGLDVAPFGIPGSTYFTGEDSKVLAEEIYLNSAGEGSWRWSAGAMFRRATEVRTTVFRAFPFPVPLQVSDSVSRSYAVFGEVTRLFMQGRLELTAGLRHFEDDIEQDTSLDGAPVPRVKTDADANTPRAILAWHATDRQMVYLSYSEGFRSGFAQDVSVPADAGIPAAAPDRLKNFEIGSKGSLGNRLAYDASVYYMNWQDIQLPISVFSPVYQQYTAAVVNSESASGVGVDLVLSLQALQGLTLKASLSWNDLKLDREVRSAGSLLFAKGDRPNSSPETTAGASAEYSFPLGSQGYKGTFLSAANYTSMQAYRAVGNVTEPLIQKGDPITLARASFSIDAPTHWTLTLYGDNLNNEQGAPVRAFSGAPNWDARVRPKTVGLQLEYSFQ